MEDATKSGYYEGILQLRNCTKEAVSFAIAKIDSKKGVNITKEIRTKDGLDLYLNSNKFLKKIGKIIKEKFPGIMKSSSKLHTVDRHTGKRVYRGTILFKMPNFSVGDIGNLRGDEVQVVSISAKVVMKETKTGKKKSYKFDDVERHFRIL